MEQALAKLQRLVELIGPNIYLQALVVAVVFILIGKIADWILSRAIGKLASRSETDIDDRLVSLLHRPIFMSFVLLGLGLATQRINLPDGPAFVTLGALKTIGTAQALFREADKEGDGNLDYGTLAELGEALWLEAVRPTAEQPTPF